MPMTVEVLVTSRPKDAGDPADPDCYGWRTVEIRQPDGTIAVEQTPLTLEDVLHPEVGDQVTHAEPHERRCIYLYDVLSRQVAGDPTAVVLHDVLVAWDVPELRPHGPDIALIRGVRARQAWTTFDVAAEGVRPDLIIEVTSPETASLDRSIKLDQYELARVAQYVIVDAVTLRREPVIRLVGYVLRAGSYHPLAANERGWLWLEPARTWLGVRDNEIVCYDEAGQVLGDYQTLSVELAEARARADIAERRQRDLEAEVRRLRGELT